MMRAVYAIVAAVLWITSVEAQTVTVRSGEHQSFTRLTLDVPVGTQWEMTPRLGGTILSLNMDSAFLDISKVFTRIQKTRLREVHTQGSQLDLSLACDCEVAVFLAQDEMLVVDISDPIISEEVLPQLSPDVTPSIKAIEEPTKPVVSRFGYGELLWSGRTRDQARVNLPNSNEELADIVSSEPNLPSHRTMIGLRSTYTRLAEAALLKGIGRAATTGLLQPNLRLRKTDREFAEPNAPETQKTPPVPERDPYDRRENLSVRSAMVGSPRAPNGTMLTQEGFVCPDPELLMVQEWGDDSGFPAQIGHWRSMLTGEFDHINRNAVVGLARTYLYFGFGAEAHSVLSIDDEVASQNELLLLIAGILDGAHNDADNILLPYTGCDSAFALWAVLAHETLPLLSRVNTDATLLAFSHLPVHLREHLGPSLSNRLLEHGEADAAADVLRIVNRALQEPLADVKMAEANLALEKGEVEDAQELLEVVVDDNSEMSPKALIALVDSKLGANEPISTETATLVAAYAQERRGSELGPELRRVHVLAQSRSNQFDAAFESMAQLRSRTDSSEPGKLRSQVLGLLAENADDITFMRLSLHQSATDISELDDEVANAMAGRLLALGFPDLAAPLIRKPAAGSANRTRRVLHARIALAKESPRRAEAELFGLTGVDIDQLVAQARNMMGDHPAAIKLFDSLSSTDEALRSAWLSEDWRRLEESNDPLYEQVISILGQGSSDQIPDATIETDTGPLAKNRTLLDQSAVTRSVLTALLETHPAENPEAE